jgi:hypothetical protein
MHGRELTDDEKRRKKKKKKKKKKQDHTCTEVRIERPTSPACRPTAPHMVIASERTLREEDSDGEEMARRKSERVPKNPLLAPFALGASRKRPKKPPPTFCPLEELIGQANRRVGWSYIPSALFFSFLFFFLFKNKNKT